MFRHTQTSLLGTSSATAALTATAGGTKAAALALTSSVNQVSVCASLNDSVLLPPAKSGVSCLVRNDGAQTLAVYGAGTDTINTASTATAFAVAAGKTAIFAAYADGAWCAVLSA